MRILVDYFARPWALPLLALAAVIAWRLSRRRRPAILYSSLSLLHNLPSGRSRFVPVGAVAAIVGFAGLLLAAAGPRIPDAATRVPTEGVAIAFVVDISGSMAEKDYAWDGNKIRRLDAAARALRRFLLGDGSTLPGRKSDLVALVVFSRTPKPVCPLTLDHSALLRLLEKQEPQSVPGESRTNIGDGIAEGLRLLRSRREGRRVMVLLSDGEHNVPSGMTPRQAAQLAANLGIPIHVIDAGSDAEAAHAEGDGNRARAEATLKDVARITGGRYFHAADLPALLKAVREIDKYERSRILSYRYLRYHDLTVWFAAAAFVMLLAAIVAENLIWRVQPAT